MARLPSYNKRNFSPAAQILAYDPSGQVTSLIPGQSLLDYIGLPEFNEALLNRVQWFSTNDVAKIEDLPLGRIIYTGGNTTIADGGGGHYVVVETGGSVVLDNGFELLLLPLGTVETGTGSEPVETALDNRWISKYTTDQLSTATSLRAGNLVRTPGYYAGWAATASGIPVGGNDGVVEERDGSAEDGGSIIFIVGTTLQVRMIFPRNIITICQFGADRTRTTDSTDKIQAALDYAKNKAIVTGIINPVDIDPGSFIVSAPLYMDGDMVALRGCGDSSELYRTTNYGHTILISDTRADSAVESSITRVSVKNFAINSTIKPTTGAHVFAIACNSLKISGILIRGGMHQGIHLKGGFRQTIKDIRADLTDALYTTVPAANSAFIVTTRNGSGATAYALPNVGNTRIENVDTRIGLKVDTYSPYQVGLDIRSSDGIWASKIYMKSATLANYRLSPSDDYASVIGFNITQSWGDHAGNHALLIEGNPTNANIAYNHFSKMVLWGAAVQNWGITQNSPIFKLSTFDDIKIFSTKEAAVNLAQSGGKLGFSKIQGFDCNTTAAVSDSVFDISGGVSGFSITDSYLGGTTVPGVTGSSAYGIKVRVGASDDYIICNNNLTENVTGGLLDQGTGTNKIVSPNIS